MYPVAIDALLNPSVNMTLQHLTALVFVAKYCQLKYVRPCGRKRWPQLGWKILVRTLGASYQRLSSWLRPSWKARALAFEQQ